MSTASKLQRTCGRRRRTGVAVLAVLFVMPMASCAWLEGLLGKEPGKPDRVIAPAYGDDEATRRFRGLIDAAHQRIVRAKDLRCLLVRTEVVQGELRPTEELTYAQRFEPHALKLKWVGEVHRGRQLVYAKGLNDDMVLVRLGDEGGAGARNKLLWVVRRAKQDWRLAPDSWQIRDGSRYPPDIAGYDALVNEVRKIYDEASRHRLAWVNAEPAFEEGGWSLRRFEVTLEPLLLEIDFSKMVIWFDLDTSLPVHTLFYDRMGRMVEDYQWQDIQLDVGLTDSDFVLEDQ